MSAPKTNELFDTLRAACARQFGFNPRRITDRIRYIGKEAAGKEIVHIFRDMGTHSQMALKNTYVTLRETQGEKPHWSESEKAHYKNTDAEIDAEIAAKQAEIAYTRTCPLYQSHLAYLLSHYKDSPSYQPGLPSAHAAAKTLVISLADTLDAQLAAFALHVQSNDPEHLAHLLLAACHLEIDAGK